MNRYLRAILHVHTEWGPDAAGATSDSSPQGDPGGARRRPRLCVLRAIKVSRARCRWKPRLQGQGLTAIIPAASEREAAPRTGRLFLFMDDPPLHAARDDD